ncbi:MAG: insulinase family protein, partial [Chloroflexota bacterium]|nr:insulinase family protein [Chloroflexota bacterium]
GMTYYIRHNEEPRVRGKIALVVKAGSVLEENDQRGLAHFVEHMAFNGTERFAKQEIVDYLESIGSGFGPDLNGYTSFDETVYFFEIPTGDDEVAETAFQILSDWAYAITFDPEEVDLERDVVLEEWRLSQGWSSRFQNTLLRLIFGSSPYAIRAPIGLPSVVEAATADDLRAFYDRWYRPDLMGVIAVGDFDVEQIEAKIKQHFAPPPEGGAMQDRAAHAPATERPGFDFTSHQTPWVNVFTDAESPGSQFVLVKKLSPQTLPTESAYREYLVESLAFRMLNARLSERAQAVNPPYLFANAGRGPYAAPLDIATFSGWVGTGGIEAGLAAVLEEIERVRQHGFTEGELEREKSNLQRSYESSYKQRDQRVTQNFINEYIDHFLYEVASPGIEIEWELVQEFLPQLSLEDFVEVAESWADLQDTALLVVRPAETEGSPDSRLADATLAQLMSASALEVEPYADTVGDVPLLEVLPGGGNIVAEEQLESVDAQRWTLSNGITVIAKQTDFRDDEVEFRAFSPGGYSLVPDEDYVSARYAAAIVGGSGVGPHDNVTLEKLLAGKRVAVSPYIDRLFEGFRGSASPEDLETMFQLVTLFATQPRVDPAFYDRYLAQLQSVAEINTADPDSVLFDTVDRVRYQDHFRARPLSVTLLEELSIERVGDVYVDRFADLGDATFVFVGAFDWDQLRSLVSTYLASLPATGRAEQWRDNNIDPPPGLVDRVVRSGIEPRGNTVVVYAGDMEWSRGEILKLNVAGEMLSIRLRERVREELGGTYGIWANAGGNPLPDNEYLISIIFGSDPDRTDELFAEVLKEVEWIRNGGDQENLDKVKELLRSAREEDLRTNGFWLGQLTNAAQRGESFDGILAYEELLESLTLEDIKEVAQRYFTLDRYMRVVLLPVEEEAASG